MTKALRPGQRCRQTQALSRARHARIDGAAEQTTAAECPVGLRRRYRHALSVERRCRPRLPPLRTLSLPAANREQTAGDDATKGPTGSAPLSPIVELRRYDLVPGSRDTLIDIFDRRLIEGQEAEGMTIIGQFRDLDDPDSFVWLRGFADMETRRKALDGFYSGPVWLANRDAANATMLRFDNVLLLRPATADGGFALDVADRPPRGAGPRGRSRRRDDLEPSRRSGWLCRVAPGKPAADHQGCGRRHRRVVRDRKPPRTPIRRCRSGRTRRCSSRFRASGTRRRSTGIGLLLPVRRNGRRQRRRPAHMSTERRGRCA